MDETLRKAIERFLGQLAAEALVKDLLLVEVDWGDHTPPVTDEPVEMHFQGARWPVIFTDSELVLRRTLCRSAQGKGILVLRGGDGFKAPLDIQARAHKRAPHRLGLRHRLYALTDRDWPPEVDYAEWRPSIERHFAALVRATGEGKLNWAITLGDLELSLVQAAFGITVQGRGAPQLLADLVAAQRRSPLPPTELERSLLRGQLRLHQVDWADVLTWTAEEVGRAEELVRTGVMMGAERAAHLSPSWGDLHKLRGLLVNERQMAESDACDVVTELATSALSHLHPGTREFIVRAAQTALADVIPADSYNRWFPLALERESARLAQRLAGRDPQAAAGVARLHDHLFAHQYRSRLSALDAMARLIAQWEEHAFSIGTLSGVSAWAGWYLQHGARMDLTALTLMGLHSTGVGDSIEALSKRYWKWRDKLNADFARLFLENYEAALHDRNAGVFGTHRILEWAVRPLLQAGQRVLLLVIDGMGCVAFWHLLDQWAAQTPPVYVRQPFDELGEPSRSASGVDRTAPKAVLSLLPSVTSVSRKGLFLNALPTDRLDDEATYEHKARTSEEDALRSVFHNDTARLYNKANLDGGQQLLNDLLVRGADLIAVILNAIDDDLKSAAATVRLPQLQDLGPLVNVVQTALSGGWTVIVTADHGHTWHRDKTLRRGAILAGGGERFAPLSPKGVAPAGAIVTQDPHILRVQEGQQVALLTDTGAYYGHGPRRGYHGGASLEEVVVPCAFLTLEAPIPKVREATATEFAEAEPSVQESYDLAGIVLTLQDGRIARLELPFTLSPTQVKLLQAVARLGEASEADLKRALRTRRIAGPLAALRERLASEGLDLIEYKGEGPQGAIYHFRREMLKS